MKRAAILALIACLMLGLAGRPSRSADTLRGDYVSTREVQAALKAKGKSESLPSLEQGTWMGNVYVLPYRYGGSYDENVAGNYNVEPRQWVAQSFFSNNPDTYDFVLVVTNFDFDSGPNLAFYNSIKNDVAGIGLDLLDTSSSFGSQRIQGYIDLKSLSAYLDAGGNLDQEKLLTILNHEIAHRWLAHCKYKDTQGNDSTALLGVDGVHWSYLLDSDASYLYGSKWSDNGDGTFSAAEVMKRYSPLDLYLMGMAPKAEIQPFTLLVNNSIPAAQLPHAGDVIQAQKQTVTADQVIASNGERQPDFQNAPHEFRVAVIYLVDPSTTSVDPQDLARLESIRGLWKASFFEQTGGRGLMEAGKYSEPPGPGESADLSKALAWLASKAQADGRWADSPTTSLRETAEAVTALDGYSQWQPQVSAGITALAATTPNSTELVAQQGDVLKAHQNAAADAIVDQLGTLGSPEAGWSAFSRYTGDPLTTARVVRAYGRAGKTADVQQAWTWLQGIHVEGQGWAWRPGAPSAIYPTLEVLLAAQETLPGFVGQPPPDFIAQSLDWLVLHRVDGGVGEPYPDVPQTAMFLKLILQNPLYTSQAAEAIHFLARHQNADGSWEQSVHKTALAIMALKPISQPDPSVLQADLSVDPASPYEGDTLGLSAMVRNAGADLQAGTAYEWQLIDSSNGSIVGTRAGSLPAIVQGGYFIAAQSWPNSASAGSYSLKFVIDPNGQINDANRGNNSAAIPLSIRQRPAGVDLRLRESAITVDPAAITQVPQALTLTGTVENLGTSAANAAAIAVFDGNGTTPLATASVSVPAQGQAPFTLALTLAEPRAYTLRVVADPANLLSDTDPSNNTVQKTVPLVTTEDLEIEAGSFTITPQTGVTVGDAVTLQVRVHNRGSVAEPTVQVGFTYAIGSPPTEYPIRLITLDAPLAPGETQQVQTTWRPNQPGNPMPLSAVVDPQSIVYHDTNRANNRADGSLVVAASTLPNLVATSTAMSITPSHPPQGQTCHISASVSNVGTSAAGAFTLELRLDDSLTGTLLASQPVSGLAPGATATIETDWLVEGTADRLVYVVADPHAVDDPHGAVTEFNEDDNSAFVVIGVQSLPDLVLTTGSVQVSPAFPRVGEAVRFDVSVANTGDQPANSVPVVLKDDQGAVLASQVISSVPAKSNAPVTLTWTGASAGGDFHLVIQANPDRTISELSYDNNAASLNLTIQNGDAYVSDRYFSPNGDGVKDSVTVFLRQYAADVLVVNSNQETVRTLSLPSGSQSVDWDGKDESGAVVPDGAYQFKAGALTTWAVVDNNLTTISGKPGGNLLEMEYASNPADTWGTMGMQSPYPGDYYLISRRGTSGSYTFHLEKCDYAGTVDLGTLPEEYTLLESSMDGRTFLVNGNSGYALLNYPGLVGTPIDLPQGNNWYEVRSLSPDGNWIIAFTYDGGFQLFNKGDLSHPISFGPGTVEGRDIQELRSIWSNDSQQAAILYVVRGENDSQAYYRRLWLGGTPQASPGDLLDWPVVFWGEWFDFVAAVDFAKSRITLTDRRKIADFDLQSGAVLSRDTISAAMPYVSSLSANGRVLGSIPYDNGSGNLYLYDWHQRQTFTHPVQRRIYENWATYDKYIFGNLSGQGPGYFIPFVTPADNLLMDLKPHVLFGNAGILLTMTVCDQNLDHYTIEYLSDQTGATFTQIGAPSREPLYNENWGTWLPPAKGRYTLRVTANDFAGNARTVSKAVMWNGDNDIANLSTRSRFIAPTGSDDARTALLFDYTVLRPCNLLFRIMDQDGNIVRLLPKAEDTAGVQSQGQWDGLDEDGNVVPDGKYALEYLGATWPITVDDTPPVVTLEIGDNFVADNGLVGKDARNIYLNKVKYSVADGNLDTASFEVRPYGGGDSDWALLETGAMDAGERDYPIEYLAGKELRIVATDLAGNRVEVRRFHKQETIYFADSEPACRSAQTPCVYPARPSIDEVVDSGGLLNQDGVQGVAKLWPSYNTFLVQQSVWDFDRSALKIEYRTPGGSWQEGIATLGSAFASRSLGLLGPYPLVPAYWDHESLPQQNYEVRLIYLNPGGETVTSPVTLFVPEFALGLEYLNRIDSSGAHYKISNLGTKTLKGFEVWVRVPDFAGTREERANWGGMPSTLEPGASAEVVTGCDSFMHASNPGSVWIKAHDDASKLYVSAECDYHPTSSGRARLATSLTPSNCAVGPASPIGISYDPEDPYSRFAPGTLSSFIVDIPSDPAGVSIAGYDLLLDGAVVFSVSNPQQSRYEGQLDLSSKPEGAHILTERYRYSEGQTGLLGSCPQTYNITVDRTPPQVAVTSPTEGQQICRTSNVQEVAFTASGNVTSPPGGVLFIDGAGPMAPRFTPSGLSAGPHALTVMVTDAAGWSACSTVHVVLVGDAAYLNSLSAVPALFSPVNTLGMPTVSDVSFLASPGAGFDLLVKDQAGTTVAASSGTVPGPDPVAFGWNGRNLQGALVPDGFYDVAARVNSLCGGTIDKSRQRAIEIDQTAPALSVTSPEPNQNVGSTLQFKGRVTDKYLSLYEIQYRSAGDCETCWTTADSGHSPVEGPSGSLGVWKVVDAAPGAYLVRVRAQDVPGNETVSDAIPVTLRQKSFIRSFSLEPSLFSPNGDGRRESLAIRFDLIQDALVTLTILDGTGQIVKTLLNQSTLSTLAGGYEYPWDGIDDTGPLAGDGAYTVRLKAEDTATPPSLSPEEESLVADLDRTPPQIDLTNIADGGLYGLPLDVNGSLSDANPGTFTIRLLGPGGTTRILAEGNSAFQDAYIATLQDLPDGAYQIVFDASDAAENVALTLTRGITIDSTRPTAQISSPGRGAFVSALELNLVGAISTAHFQNYSWQYAAGTQPGEADFQEILSGTTMPDNGHSEYAWNISSFQDGPYTLRLVVTDQLGRTQEDRLVFTVDRTLPEVGITLPVDGQVLSAPQDVTGLARDANLSSWVLEAASSNGGAYEQRLGEGTAPVDNGLLAQWILLPPDGPYTLRLSAQDKAGNNSVATLNVVVSGSTIGPPVNLTATVQNRADVLLAWQPAPGTLPSGYNLYRGAQRVNASPLTAMTYVDPNLPQGSYTYTVRALDPQGQESGDSNPASVVITLNAPIALISSPPQGGYVSGTVEVRGTAYKDTEFKEYRLSVRSAPSGNWTQLVLRTAPVIADRLGTWDSLTGSWPDGSYELKLDAEDLVGNVATANTSVTLDNTPPSLAPILDEAALAPPDSNQVHLSWHYENPPSDLAGYYLYRDGVLANAPGPVIGSRIQYRLSEKTYNDLNVPDGTHVYTVTGADFADNESPFSNSKEVAIETRRPHATITSPADNAQIQGLTIVQAECPDTDVTKVQFLYKLASDTGWTPMGDADTQKPYSAEFTPPAQGSYLIQAVASDATGDDPTPTPISVTVTDLPPGSPLSLVARVDGGDVILTWQAPPDPFGDLVGYRIYRGGVLITATALPKTTLTYTDSGRDDGDYRYTLRAVDQAGNESPDSTPAEVYIYTPFLGYVQPINAVNTADLEGYWVRWPNLPQLQKRDAAGVFQVVRSLDAGDSSGSYTFSNVALTPGLNVFRLIGTDSSGNRSKPSNLLVLVYHDTPATPSDLAAAVTGSDVSLSWTAPADADSAGFRIARNGEVINETDSSLPYDSATQQISASCGTPEEAALAVDGNPGTGWIPASTSARPSREFWQWTWLDEHYVSKVTLTWAPTYSSYAFDLEVQVQGEWMWWSSYDASPALVEIPLNVVATGIRVRPVGARCGWYSWCLPPLNEVQVETLQRTPASPYLDAGLPQGVYPYSVQQVNRWGQESGTMRTNAFVGVPPPSPPSGLAVVPSTTCGELVLNWSAPDPLPDGLTGYVVYRSQDGGAHFDRVASVGSSTTTYSDVALPVGIPNTYEVTATMVVTGASYETVPSNIASGTPSCDNPPAPVITYPTTAGHPLILPGTETSVGGTAVPGAEVHLLQDGADVAVTQTQRPVPIQLDGYNGGVLSLSGDGNAVAYEQADPNTGDTSVAVLDVSTGASMYLGTGTSWDGEPAISPDGRKVVYVSEKESDGASNGLFLFDRQEGTESRLPSIVPWHWGASFSPDGRFVAYAASDNQQNLLNILDLQSLTSQTLYTSPDVGLNYSVFSPDGLWIALEAGSEVLLVNRVTGEVRHATGTGWTYLSAHPFSADGSRLVYVSETPDPPYESIRIYDLASGNSTPLLMSQETFAATWYGQDTIAFLLLDDTGTVTLRQRNLSTNEEKDLFTGLSPSALPWREFCLNQNAGGTYLVAQGQTLVPAAQGAAAFSFPDRFLHPGVNQFVARQVIVGTSQDSLPIEVDANPSAFPDAMVAGMQAFSAFPLAGDQVLVTGAVTNSSQVVLNDCRIVLQRQGPDGALASVLEQVASLQPGETALLRYTWDTTGLSGDFGWTIEADPNNVITEADETNNRGKVTVYVRGSRGAEVRCATDQGGYLPGGTVAIQNTLLSNDVTKDYTLTTSIEDEQGVAVATVDTRNFAAFGAGTAQYGLSWPIPAIYPGSYRVHLKATVGADLAAEAFSPFVLLSDLRLTAHVATDKAVYVPGSTVNVTGVLDNLGTSLLQNLTAILKIQSPGSGGIIASQPRAVPSLPAGSSLNVTWAWASTGAPAGDYNAALEVKDAAGVTVVSAAPSSFTLGGGGPNLTGTLSITPQQPEPSNPLAVHGVAHNAGDTALTGVAFKISIVDPTTTTSLSEYTETADLAAGSDHAVDHTFDISALQRRTYAVVFTAAGLAGGQTFSKQLASVPLDVVDVTPPRVVLVSPSPGLVCDQVSIRIQAADAFSGIDRAFYRLDHGTQDLPLAADPPPNTQNAYGAIWSVPAGQDGPHHLSLLARDLAGNVSTPVEVDVTADLLPPAVTLEAPAEGSCSNQPVAITYGATDLHLVSVAATLNGQPYVSGTAVAQEGSYALVVTALDGCQHLTSLTRHFGLGWSIPTLGIPQPQEGACATPGIIPVFETTPQGLAVHATLNGQTYSPGTPITAQGEYTLEATAADLCGNVSAPVTRHFKIDTAPPGVTINSPAEGACAQPGLVPDIQSSEQGVTWTITLDGTAYTRGTPISATGNHILVATATDTCGNASQPVTRHFNIGSAAPVVTIVSPSEGTCAQAGVVPDIQCSEQGVSWTITLDGTAYALGTPVTAPGGHALVAIATNACGTASQPVTRHFTIDATPPVVTINSPAEGACAQPGVVPDIQSSEQGVTWAITLDGTAYTRGTPISATGNHTLVATATDTCGNASQPVTRHFNIGSAAPVVTIVSPAEGTCAQAGVVPDIQCSEQGVSWTITLDGTAYALGTPVTAPGGHALVAIATNACGTASQPVTRHFTIDATPPVVTIYSPAEGDCAQAGVVPDIQCSEQGVTWTITLDGAEYTLGTPIAATGSHTLVAFATNACGNASEPVTRHFTVQDSPAPTLPSWSGRFAWFGCNSMTANGSVKVYGVPSVYGSQGFGGNIGSNGGILINGSVLIDGDATPGPGRSVTINGSHSQVVGSVAPAASILPCEAQSIAAWIAYAQANNANAQIPRTFLDGNRNFTLNGNKTCTLPGGTYYVNNFTCNGNAKLVLTGPSVFVATGAITINSTVKVNEGAAPSNLILVEGSNASATLNGNAKLSLKLYAPLSTVTVNGNVTGFGNLWGKDFTGNGSVIWNRLNDGTAPSLSINQPEDGSTVAGPKPQVAISYQDDATGTGLDLSSFHVKLDGLDITGSLSVTSCGASGQIPVALSAGSHTLQASISDYEPNATQAQSAFTVTAAAASAFAARTGSSQASVPVTRVLLFDPEKPNAVKVSAFLAGRGLQVIETTNSCDFAEALRSDSFDMVVSDRFGTGNLAGLESCFRPQEQLERDGAPGCRVQCATVAAELSAYIYRGGGLIILEQARSSGGCLLPDAVQMAANGSPIYLAGETPDGLVALGTHYGEGLSVLCPIPMPDSEGGLDWTLVDQVLALSRAATTRISVQPGSFATEMEGTLDALDGFAENVQEEKDRTTLQTVRGLLSNTQETQEPAGQDAECALTKLGAAFEALSLYSGPGSDALRMRVARLIALGENAWRTRG